MNGIGNFWRLEKMAGVTIRIRLTGGQLAAPYIRLEQLNPHNRSRFRAPCRRLRWRQGAGDRALEIGHSRQGAGCERREPSSEFPQEADGLANVADGVLALLGSNAEIAAIPAFFEHSQQFDEVDGAFAERHIHAACSSKISKRIVRVDVKHVLRKRGERRRRREPVRDQVAWIESHSERACGERINQLRQAGSVFTAGDCGQHSADALSVLPDLGQRLHERIPSRPLRLVGNHADLVDDNAGSQLEREPHRLHGPIDALLQLVGYVVAPPRTVGHRANPHIQIIQNLSQLAQACARHIAVSELAACINFHGIGPQFGCRMQGFHKRQLQACQLDCHGRFWHGDTTFAGQGHEMIQLLLPLYILAMDGSTPTATSGAEAALVASWDFESTNDKDFDAWPDGWVRHKAPGYPVYVDIGIVPENGASPNSRYALRIDLDGGAGRIDSPPVELQPQFSYLLQGRLHAANLKFDSAAMTLLFLDAKKNVVETHNSNGPAPGDGWIDISVGPVAPTHPEVCFAVVSLSLQPGAASDLRGTVWFDDIRLGRLPRMTLRANRENNLFFDNDVEIRCLVSGFSRPDLPVRFELLDVEGQILSSEEVAARHEDSEEEKLQTGIRESHSAATHMLSGVATWKPKVQGNGFFQVRATIQGQQCTRDLNLVVMDPLQRGISGEFGWSLPRGDLELSLRDLNRLLPEAGIHWVKFPVWYEAGDQRRAEELARFAERLRAQRIQMVGMLDAPPPSLKKLFGALDPLPVASVFVEPAVWWPALDPILTRLSLVVRWWQLGSDNDMSFVGLPELNAKFSKMRDDVGRFGHDLQLGMAWRMLDEVPASEKPAWSFVCFKAEPPPTAEELRAGLPSVGGPAQRWVLIDPLPCAAYGLQEQCRDLVLRMIAAKQAGAQGIFVPDPFAAERGLLRDDGTPARLFLPWRTTAMLISGSQFVGHLLMDGGSNNSVFARGDEAVLVLWSDAPVRERVQLGPNVRLCDVWGRISPLPTVEQGGQTYHEVEVGPQPVFLIGADSHVVQWNLGVRFEPAKLDSVFGQPQVLTCRFANTFPQIVSGTITLDAPEAWELDSRKVTFRLGTGEERQLPFRVLLNANANSGSHPVRLQFNFVADKEYRFSVARQVGVGLDDLEVYATSHLDEQGNLVVEQHLQSKSERELSFDCLLSAPDRRRLRQKVFKLGQGNATTTFVLPRGRELVGSTLWLRAEEIDGPRILNYRLVATE